MRNERNREQRGVFYAVMILLTFLMAVLLILGGLFLFRTNGDFYSAFRTRLDGGFYLSAWLVLLFSSVLYTPFSYGISYYFILGSGRFRDVFFLFRQPLLLAKAVAVSILKKVLINLERLVLLLAAAVLELLLFFAFLVVSGGDVFSLQEDPFRLAAEFMLRSPWLIGLSILLWSGVLLGMVFLFLRYILCKYVLICYPEVGVFQAVRVGRFAIRRRLWKTLVFYLRYSAGCILALFPRRFWRRRRRENFSRYARRMVEEGWKRYCRRRSLR